MKWYFFILWISFTLVNHKSFANKKDSLIYKNYSIMPLPVLSYNSDVGFTGGIIGNYYYYGKKRKYFPDYKAFTYIEATYSTKGTGIFRIITDYKNIVPNIRITSDIGLFTEKNMPFWGFNAYTYKYSFSQNEKHNYFKIKREMYYGKFGIYLSLRKSLYSFVSFTFNKINIFPKEKYSLLNDFKQWGVLKDATSGYNNFISVALTYDSRKPVAANPNSGILSEANIIYAPAKINNRTKGYVRSFLTLKSFIPIIVNRMVFASRFIFSKKIMGNIPYYAIPFYHTSLRWYDAVGGVKTIRGMERDRLAITDYMLTNIELRIFLKRFNLFSTSATLVFYPYLDIVKAMLKDVGKNKLPLHKRDLFLGKEINNITYSYGGGMGMVLNYNLVLNITAGVPANKNFGTIGIFAGLDYVF